ncbi:hypothetical protein [Aurantimicrobium sp.]|uniref:hypothetical protein n=1 Tax=Aurantimicrobium sp. TaxID=1930784 RepID=UPI002FCA87D2
MKKIDKSKAPEMQGLSLVAPTGVDPVTSRFSVVLGMNLIDSGESQSLYLYG